MSRYLSLWWLSFLENYDLKTDKVVPYLLSGTRLKEIEAHEFDSSNKPIKNYLKFQAEV